MEFVLNRDYCLRSTSGHMINFKKGQPTYVPPACHREAVNIGADPVDGKVEMLDPETKPRDELSQEDRNELLYKAFAFLEKRNKRGDFTAQGLPVIGAIEKETGLDDVSSKERNEAWQTYREAKAS